jgi:uncharacterized protein (UPF0264 family)
MRLLVSVRSAAEVVPAVGGGADIVDAKEPARGALGAVSGPVLLAIAERVPVRVPLSVALGDPEDLAGLTAAMAVLDRLEPRRGPLYMKIGLSGAGARGEVVLRAAVEAASGLRCRPSVVAVAYADHAAAAVPPPETVLDLARAAGVDGVLLDTWGKGAGDLFDHMGEARLRSWVAEARAGGMLVALAGSLTLSGVRAAAALSADVIGVRGAACTGGRAGVVAVHLVRELKAAVAAVVSGCSPHSASSSCTT